MENIQRGQRLPGSLNLNRPLQSRNPIALNLKRRLVKFSQGQRHFMKARVHFTEHGIRLVFSGREPLTGMASRENFDSLLDGGHGIKMELALGDGFDHFFAQHQVVHIFAREAAHLDHR